MNTEFVLAQEHNPPAGAHLMVLAGIVIAALVILGVRRWRTRRDTGSNRHGPASSDRSSESPTSREER
jgi:hypothetical protein